MLIFLLCTRPDVTFAVNTLATRCAGATIRDLDAIHEVILYLKCTAHLGSSFQCHTVGRLYGWADAAYACHRDGKSHSGMFLSYGLPGTGKFSSTSKKQSLVCLSSTEAELYAAGPKYTIEPIILILVEWSETNSNIHCLNKTCVGSRDRTRRSEV